MSVLDQLNKIETEQALRQQWLEMKEKGLLIEAWTGDFECFFYSIGKPPFQSSRLVRKHKDLPLGPDNFLWVD
jgi:hypothetical protein